ncbi:efflux RND transporter periplasmic adaptor subunit [Salinisphaera japonica]|uniref:Cation transporter n=1 Tax=Salinisphaera japonica YTM-1 TaxID=1209778 RepID=A0A423PFB6_9GAMM|nr:efflux RND transporter periplasmic adaptor subunit [Salinisphaera japonica]ROO24331.1 cation transporter [Salinisphaera japonica YTM-1]
MSESNYVYAAIGVLLTTVSLASGCDASSPEEQSAPAGAQPQPSSKTETQTDNTAEHDEAHAAKPRRIHLTPEQREQLPIRVTQAPAGSAEDTIQAPADVRFDADKVAEIGPRLASKVVAVKTDLGERVAVGDPLAVLDSVALGKAKARYLTTTAQYRNALAVYKRKQDLAEDKIISQAALDEARATYQSARASRRAIRAELKLYGLTADQIAAIDTTDGDAPLSRFTLRAPIAGTIQRRDAVIGQTVASNETPFQVVDASQMWVMIHVAENNAARMQPGLAVSLRVRSLPGRRFEGTTNWVSEALDADSRTLTVRAVVDNTDRRLSADMFGTATIQTEGSKDYALVPTDAVQTLDGDESAVFVPGSEPGAFRVVPVTLGHEGNGQVEIRDGLAAGDAVVTGGAFDLMSALTSGSRSAAHGH